MRWGIGGLVAVCFLLFCGWWISAEVRRPDSKVIFHRELRYREGPGVRWRLDLAEPKDRSGKPRPVIVVIHGGGWLEGDQYSFTYRENGPPGNIEDFAELGFVAATINYRLSKEAPFPAALEDCKCAVRWLRARAKDFHIDPGRIGAYGNSAGGHLALLLGMVGKEAGFEGDGPNGDESSLVQAAVSDSGPLDLLYQYRHDCLKEVVERFMGGPPVGEREALYRKASPCNRIGPGTPPVLLIYGGADEQVPVQTADRFVADLGRAGLQDVTYYRLAHVDHCPHSLVHLPELRPAVNEFFLRTLMYPETARKVRGRPESP
jgi:acetyl esterase/lipase